MPPRTFKLKHHRDTTVRLSEWPKSETLTTANADEDVEQQELSFSAHGKAEWHRHFGRQFKGVLLI